MLHPAQPFARRLVVVAATTALGLSAAVLLPGCSGGGSGNANPDETAVEGAVPIAYVKRVNTLGMNPTNGAPSAEGGDLMVRVGQPAVLGELLVGVLLGNLTLFGIHGLEFLRPEGVHGEGGRRLAAVTLDMLARIGVILLLFHVPYPLFFAALGAALRFIPYLGPLIAGLLAEYAARPDELVFWVDLGLLVPAAALVRAMPETVTRRGLSPRPAGSAIRRIEHAIHERHREMKYVFVSVAPPAQATGQRSA